jgi:hypothetical protein
MLTEYELRIYNRAGALQYILTQRKGLLALSYSKRVNQVGVCRFTVNADNAIVDVIDLDWQVEVRRRDAESGLAWYVDFYGLFRDEERSANDDGISTFTGTAYDANDWLARAIVAYNADITDRTKFTTKAVETIAKTLVTRNATAAGSTGDGREVAVGAWGAFITVQANGSAGATVDYACAYRPLLESLQELASVGSGDFNMVKTGAEAWDFRWYNGQLGTDRSGSVTFDLALDNMSNPVLKRVRSAEYTVAIAGGQDTGTARTVVVRTGANYNTTYNASEMFVQAGQYSTSGGVTAAADARLREVEARDDLTFDVKQVPATLYGKHYFLGDLVTGTYQGVTATKQIVGVTVSFAPAGDNPEKITVVVADP